MKPIKNLKTEDEQVEIDLFICAFLFQFEELVNESLDYFNDVRFQMDEANTDQEIKIKLKEFMLNQMNLTKEITVVYDENKVLKTKKEYVLEYIKVPSELDNNDKDYIKSIRNAQYTDPDLLFYVTNTVSKTTYMMPVEVKSTKGNNIPGSSVQQIGLEDWVIFIKHDKNKINKIITGKYINSLNGKIQFPDRSPRPQVCFDSLDEWNRKNRIYNGDILSFTDDGSSKENEEIFINWQYILANRWVAMLFNNREVSSKWFDDNLRKFILLFLEKYNSLTKDEQKKFIEKTKTDIERKTHGQ